jgi:putative glutamine amidotransferase
MSKPRIGVTCSPLRAPGYYDRYLRAVELAGAEAVRLAPRPRGLRPEEASGLLRHLDGLLLPGGWDVDPAEYGEAREATTEQVDTPLDRTEIALVRGAAGAGIPLFGICRGQQLINVALGGTLHQHVDGHDTHGQPRHLLAHPVTVDPDSELAAAAGAATLLVNSLHHQAVRVLAPGLRSTARSPDGVVEGLESPDRLVVAVQCHPEELIGRQEWALALLRRFAERARERSGGRRVAAAETAG